MEIPFTVKDRPDTGLFNSKIGIWLFLASEVMLFGGLFSGYVFLRLGADYPWPIHALQATMKLGAINTAVLIASSVTVVMAWTALKLHRWREFQLYMGATILCAAAFCCIKSIEYSSKLNHFAVVTKDGTELHGHLAHTDLQPGDDYVLDLERVGISTFHRESLDIGSLLKLDETLRAGREGGAERRRLFDPTSAAVGRALAGLDQNLVHRALDGLIDPSLLNGTVTRELLLARRKAEAARARLARDNDTIDRRLAIQDTPAAGLYHAAYRLSPAEQATIDNGSASDGLRQRLAEFDLRREVLAQLGAAATGDTALIVASYDPQTDDQGQIPAADPAPAALPHYHFSPGITRVQIPGGFTTKKGYILLGEVGPQYIYLSHVDVIDIRRLVQKSPDLAMLDQTLVGRVPELRNAWNHHWEEIREGEKKRASTKRNGERVENPFSDYHRYTVHLLKKEQYVHFSSPEALGLTGPTEAAADATATAATPAAPAAEAPEVPAPAAPATTVGEGVAATAAGPADDATPVTTEAAHAEPTAHAGAGAHAEGDHGGHGDHGYLAIPRDQVRHASALTPRFNTFYAIYYLMTSLHALHVIGGALVLGYFLFFGKKLYDKDPEHMANRVEVGGLFWHFVDLVWIFLFPLLYLL